MSRRVTMSGLALLHACGYSFRPDVESLPEAESDEAKRGTAFAALAEAAINGTDDPQPGLATLSAGEAELLERMWEHAATWLQANARICWRAEVAFAWDPETDTGRELPRAAHRDYSAAPEGWLPGTADVVAMDLDVVVIYDWKTHAPGAPDVDARDQLCGLALAAARAYRCDSARIVTLNVTAERGVEPVSEDLDAFALDEIAERLRADMARIAGAEPVDGDHCTQRYCKALATCPKTAAVFAGAAELAQVVPPGALVRHRYSPIIESTDQVAWMLAVRPVLRKYLEACDATIEAHVADGPKLTSTGDEVRQQFRTMTRMNQGALLELAKAKGATDEEISACARTAVESNGVRVKKAAKRGRAA